jgi:lipoyl(octanoyl) transferase
MQGPADCVVRWLGTVPYRDALVMQREVHDRVVAGGVPHTILLVEHPPVYTLGRRGGRECFRTRPEELVRLGAEVVETDRGGLVTFHGPGQLVAYPILHLERMRLGLGEYVAALLGAIVAALGRHGVDGTADLARPGVFVQGRKIASVGVRRSRGVTTHGCAVNLSTDLAWFEHIDACGLAGIAATSVLAETGRGVEVRGFGEELTSMLASRLGLSTQDAWREEAR